MRVQYRAASQVDFASSLHKLAGLFRHSLLLFRRAVRGANLFCNLHRTELRPAHGAEVGGLGGFMRQCFVVIFARTLRIEAQIKLVLPAKLEARLRERIVPKLRPRPSLRQVHGVRSDFVADDACTDVLFIWKTEVLLGSDVAEHRGPVPADLCRADRAGDVIVARSDVGDERTQCVEGRVEAMSQFLIHIFPNELHRYMTGTFDHYLHVMLPSAFCQLSQRPQLSELSFVIGIVNRAGAKTIPQAEGDVVSLHDFANFIEIRVKKVLLMVCKAPLRHDWA